MGVWKYGSAVWECGVGVLEYGSVVWECWNVGVREYGSEEVVGIPPGRERNLRSLIFS